MQGSAERSEAKPAVERRGETAVAAAPAMTVTSPTVALMSLQRSAGNRAVSGLLRGRGQPQQPPADASHPLSTTAADSPTAQRLISIVGSGGASRNWGAPEARSYVAGAQARLSRRGADPMLVEQVVLDLHDAGDSFSFDGVSELDEEVLKRVVAASLMVTSQRPEPSGDRPFGYPYRNEHARYGPRVNAAADGLWTPRVSDSYSRRRSRQDDAVMRFAHTENDRATGFNGLYGDPTTGYRFELTPTGLRDPYRAVLLLFQPQPPHRRTLIHCDYHLSLVQYRAFAQSIGQQEFNRRVQASRHPLALTALGFDDISAGERGAGRPINAATGRSTDPEMASLELVRPSSPQDFVVGDHVRFYNHPAYELLIEASGGVWTLENSILVDRDDGVDHFMGHGSGRQTAAGMRRLLAHHFNENVDRARAAARRVPRSRVDGPAMRRFKAQYPKVDPVPGGGWTIHGVAFGRPINQPLARVHVDDIPGFYDPSTYNGPADPGRIDFVRRPIEGRRDPYR